MPNKNLLKGDVLHVFMNKNHEGTPRQARVRRPHLSIPGRYIVEYLDTGEEERNVSYKRCKYASLGNKNSDNWDLISEGSPKHTVVLEGGALILPKFFSDKVDKVDKKYWDEDPEFLQIVDNFKNKLTDKLTEHRTNLANEVADIYDKKNVEKEPEENHTETPTTEVKLKKIYSKETPEDQNKHTFVPNLRQYIDKTIQKEIPSKAGGEQYQQENILKTWDSQHSTPVTLEHLEELNLKATFSKKKFNLEQIKKFFNKILSECTSEYNKLVEILQKYCKSLLHDLKVILFLLFHDYEID